MATTDIRPNIIMTGPPVVNKFSIDKKCISASRGERITVDDISVIEAGASILDSTSDADTDVSLCI
jgi:hypothetical protein